MIYNNELEYQIIDFISATGQIVVECVGLDYRVTIDLPIVGGQYPEAEALDTYIRGFIPNWVVDRSIKIKNGIPNEEYFYKLTNKTPEEIQTLKETEIRTLRDRMLKDCDWTMLPDAGISPVVVERIKKYRQELRDVPQQPGFPNNFIWPETTGEWPNHPDKKH
jgi:hypothetical protein